MEELQRLIPLVDRALLPLVRINLLIPFETFPLCLAVISRHFRLLFCRFR